MPEIDLINRKDETFSYFLVVLNQMSNYKELSFIRYENDDIVKIEPNKEIWHSVTFAILENDTVIAKLITNNWKAFSCSMDSVHLSIKGKYSFWRQIQMFQIYNDENQAIVEVKVNDHALYKIFTPRPYDILFKDIGKVAIREFSSKQLRELNAYSGYEFIQDNMVISKIINFERPSLSFNPTKTKMKGFIIHLDNLSVTNILCLLQIMNIYIAMEFDIN